MTQEQFLQSVTLKNVSQVYSGKDHCCRCGCRGTYTATSYMKNPRTVINDSLVEKRLKRAKKLIAEGAEYDFGGSYVNIVTGNDRALTLYFDELKD